MSKLLRSLPAAVLALLALMLLAGCTAITPPAAATEPAPAQAGLPGAIRIQLAGDPTTLDPNLVEDFTSASLVEQLFLGLTNINNETEEVEPELAESWNVSDDGLVWTFNLRHDALWSDGTPLTARDVVYSVQRAVKPETASPYAYVLYIIKNAAAINQTAVPTATYDIDALGVKAPDDYTVEFTLETPAPYFESISSLWTLDPVPGWTIEKYGDAWTDPANLVTSGPYLLKESRAGEQLTFEKNPLYYAADDVQIERIEGRIVEDMNTAVALYEAGDLDMVGDVLPLEVLTRIRQDPQHAAELHEGQRAATVYVGFTMTKPPFDNVLVRKAFSAAIDRETLARDVIGFGAPATELTTQGVFGSPDPEVGQGYDPQQAQAWLAEAGYPDGEGFPTVTYRFIGSQQWAEALQAMWKETLNVNVELEPSQPPAYFGSIAPDVPVEEMPHLWFLTWFADYPDANNFTYEVFHCTDSPNRPRAACTQADDLAKAAGREGDREKRKEMYRQVEQMLFGDEVRAAPYWHRGFAYLTKPFIERTYPSFAHPNWDTWRLVDTSALSLRATGPHTQRTIVE